MSQIIFKPLTIDLWPDFECLFNVKGPQNGCWCMYWRTTRAAFHKNFGERNKQAFMAIVKSGPPPGIIAYDNVKPIGWCAIAPRQDYGGLERSRTLKRVDDKPVWSIVCFYIHRDYRRAGITEKLIKAAVKYAKNNGAHIIEAYPLQNEILKSYPYDQYMGVLSTFRRLGFKKAVQRSARRSIMRLTL